MKITSPYRGIDKLYPALVLICLFLPLKSLFCQQPECGQALPPLAKQLGFINKMSLWPEGVVPYSFDLADGEKSYALIPTMQRAAARLNRETNVCWVNVPKSEAKVRITLSEVKNLNFATLGYQPALQGESQIEMWSDDFGVALHEMGHILGLYHEQQRPDRDEYVTVYPENIESKYLYAFEKLSGESDSLLYDTPYDVYSIMHYHRRAFSINGQPTITYANGRRLPDIPDRLSEWDIADINQMYPGITREECDQRVAAYRPARINVAIELQAKVNVPVVCTMDEVALLAVPLDSLQNANTYRWTTEYGSPNEYFGSTYPVRFVREGSQNVQLEVRNGKLKETYTYTVNATAAGVQLSVAPNLVARGTPIQATVRTTSPDFRLRLIGVDGRTHYAEEVTGAYCEEERTVPTTALAAGVYLLQAFLEGEWHTERVILQ